MCIGTHVDCYAAHRCTCSSAATVWRWSGPNALPHTSAQCLNTAAASDFFPSQRFKYAMLYSLFATAMCSWPRIYYGSTDCRRTFFCREAAAARYLMQDSSGQRAHSMAQGRKPFPYAIACSSPKLNLSAPELATKA
eukprot:107506-Rhodomonas_salina.1